jgi:hypothetical protein
MIHIHFNLPFWYPPIPKNKEKNGQANTYLLRFCFVKAMFYQDNLRRRRKKMKKFALLFIVFSFIFCGIGYVQPCYAERGDGRYSERHGERHVCEREVRGDLARAHRIVQHGIRTRQIDHREAESIRHNLKRVENDLDRYLSDGRLSQRECDNLKQEIHGLHRHIKHDLRD